MDRERFKRMRELFRTVLGLEIDDTNNAYHGMGVRPVASQPRSTDRLSRPRSILRMCRSRGVISDLDGHHLRRLKLSSTPA